MKDDAVIQRIRQERRAFLKECDDNIEIMFERIKAREKRHPGRLAIPPEVASSAHARKSRRIS